MRTYLRQFAVVVPLVLIVALVATPARGQYKVNMFDSAVADSQFAIVFNATANGTEPYPIHVLTDDATDKQEGSASLKSVWRVHTTESWGGLNMLSFTLPTKSSNSYYANKYRAMYGDSTYIDWDGGTYLSLWYNNLSPSTATGNGVQMRFHIYEAGPGASGNPGSAYYTGDSLDYEDWYFQSATPLNTTDPGWHELIIPLKDTGTRNNPGDQGFCITDWSARHFNDQLDLNRIIGYTIEWTAGKVANDTAGGIVFYDNLRLGGLGYKPGYEALYFFNDFTKDTTDFNAGWTNGGLSAFDLYEEKTDTLMGSSVMGVDWKINVKESWGGGCNKEYNIPGGAFFQDISNKTELQLYAKVAQPLTSSTGTIDNKITLRFVLFDYSNGTKEEWYTIAPIRMDSVGATMGWQQIILPLNMIQSSSWGDLKVGQFNTPNGTQDGVFQGSKVGGFKLEFSSSRDGSEPFADNLVYSGKVLFSAVIPAGLQETDHTPPATVSGVNVTPQSFANILQWTDVPGELGATYTGWVSEQPFTSVDDPGVEDIPPTALPTGTQLANHLLRAPISDQQVSLYYGVSATDKAGNANQPTVVGPIANTAKGVPTFSMTPPSSFQADGDLSEWSGIAPFLLSVNPATPTCHVAANTKIDGDADLKVNGYLAVDATYLYVAFDVDDDVISIDTSSSASDWLQDSPDLFIGLYDWRGHHHGSYQHGAVPDYHLRFSLNQIKIDNDGLVLMKPGTDYAFVIKQLTSGYTIEARIPWTLFQEKVPTDSVFSPKEGMRIPIDFEINDNDTPGDNAAREGIMAYSTLNDDNSWSAVWHWTHTWLGTKSSTGVKDQPTVAYVYELTQNYPNPFNPSTMINYSLAKAGPVTLKVFDVLGREVATLVNGEVQSAGNHQVAFSTSTLAHGASSGVYFYRIESGSFRDVKKMMLIK
jgi:hypothetical protein